jgi:hypothetical protein
LIALVIAAESFYNCKIGAAQPFSKGAFLAKIAIDDAAVELARERVSMMKYERPILWVGWWDGVKDNSRAKDGSVIWKTVEPASWRAMIMEPRGGQIIAKLPDGAPIEEIDGLQVFRDEKAAQIEGVLRVRADDGAFVVVHERE